jgi:hypothetical protein
MGDSSFPLRINKALFFPKMDLNKTESKPSGSVTNKSANKGSPNEVFFISPNNN